MTPDGSTAGGSFFSTVTAAVRDFEANGFDSQARLDHWVELIRAAAINTLTPPAILDEELRSLLVRVYDRQVNNGAILKRHPGVGQFTLDRVKPQMRADLDRRIRASASLIKLNQEEAVAETIRRLSGWATSIPAGGSEAVDVKPVKDNIRKSLAQLPFEARRVCIDQSHKFAASLNLTLAEGGNALAGEWRSHWRQAGYHYRIDHKERDMRVYAFRKSWAMERGLITKGDGYIDDQDQVAEKPFCRCWMRFLYNLRDLPVGMLTEKGVMALAEAKARVAAFSA